MTMTTNAKKYLASNVSQILSPDAVEVAAYVDAAGDLLVELPRQRGCVEVREATREESDESQDTAEGWITTHVARHLLVAVGYLPAEV